MYLFFILFHPFLKEKQENLVSGEMKMPLTAPEKSVILQVTTYMETVSGTVFSRATGFANKVVKP